MRTTLAIAKRANVKVASSSLSHGANCRAARKSSGPSTIRNAQRQHRQGCDQHVGDRFQPQHKPVPHLYLAVGAVEADPQALHAA